MENDYKLDDSGQIFDFRGFIFKVLSYWYFIIIAIIIGLGIAYYINVRKLPIYSLSSVISIKSNQNPLFTSNTSLTFNWGGASDKTNTVVTTLQTRTHNEKVVSRLQYYLNYFEDGKYQKIDAYGKTPFTINIDTLHRQLLKHYMTIEFIDSTRFRLSINFEEEDDFGFMDYTDKSVVTKPVDKQKISKKFRLGEDIRTPFFNGKLVRSKQPLAIGKPYYILFSNFNTVVKNYQSLNVRTLDGGSSILTLSLHGKNKQKITDYLNTTVGVLSSDMLKRKNLFATKTIQFIDSSLSEKSKELKIAEDTLNDFKVRNQILDISGKGAELRTKLNVLDVKENGIEQQLDYYKYLKDYLQSHSDYRKVPAPSVVGIEEPSISSGVRQILKLSEERAKYVQSVKKSAPIYGRIDEQINAAKTVLLENISSSKKSLNRQLSRVRSEIEGFEAEVRKLPKQQQDLLKIQRKYDISQQTYNLFLSKRNEAGLIRAANVSDVLVIEKAKPVSAEQIGPKTRLNYVMAVLGGFFIPLIVVFFIVFFDDKIKNTDDIKRLSPIPLVATVSKNLKKTDLVIYNQPKSAISESFRSLRTSLQFIYAQKGISGSKTVLVTSSVSQEGKTFCSANLASVFAISNKKTILVGLDLRRPSISEDFNVSNKVGVVDYLIGRKELSEVIQTTRHENLDVITAGAIPPNPSELLMSEKMNSLLEDLKEQYDYIVLDTPPIGLVSDALNLMDKTDAVLYVIRQNYSKKSMLHTINEKYRRGEVKNISFVFNYYRQKGKYGYGYGKTYNDYGYYDNSIKNPKPSFWKRIFKKR